MMHTFRKEQDDSGIDVYVVGYWAPYEDDHGGSYWVSLLDFDTAGDAARWVNYLNGGKRPPEGSEINAR